MQHRAERDPAAAAGADRNQRNQRNQPSVTKAGRVTSGELRIHTVPPQAYEGADDEAYALSNLDAKGAKKNAEKALKSGDREGARDILANLVEGNDKLPLPRIVVNDTTVEKLGELLNEKVPSATARLVYWSAHPHWRRTVACGRTSPSWLIRAF